MASVDCLLIGHNESSIARERRMLLYLYGRNSHEYRDRVKYNLSHLAVGKERYSPMEFYNHVRRQGMDGSQQDLSIITESFNLAVACLGNALHKNGLSFDFVNSFQDEKEKLKQRLRKDEVRTVGIITTYYLSHSPIYEIVSFVRKHGRNAKIIVGGPFVINKFNSLDEDRLKELFETIGADYFVRDSFGEDILVDLVRRLKSGSDLSQVRNLYYRQGDGFRFSHEKTEPYDFEANQIDWTQFKGRLAPVVNLRTAVSCPYSCAFCNFPLYAGKYSLSPIEYCEREMRQLKDQGVRSVQFVDDTFNVPKKRFQDLLRMMVRNRFGFRWNSYFKCQYADRETVELMKESGCEFVFLGIESGSQTILDNMDKRNSVEVYRQCLDLFNELDIMTMCSVIVGYPGETADTFQETFSFIEQTRPTFYQQRLFWYDRTAPVHQLRQKFGLEGEGYSWKHATMDSEEAHQLADQLFLNIQNSIHITEYALPFFLLGRGMSKDNLKLFLKNYMRGNREQYLNPHVETHPSHLEGLCRSAGVVWSQSERPARPAASPAG